MPLKPFDGSLDTPQLKPFTGKLDQPAGGEQGVSAGDFLKAGVGSVVLSAARLLLSAASAGHHRAPAAGLHRAGTASCARTNGLLVFLCAVQGLLPHGQAVPCRMDAHCAAATTAIARMIGCAVGG